MNLAAIVLAALLASCVRAVPKGVLTQEEFAQATWDLLNEAGAESKWGPIADLDTSIVTNMQNTFRVNRNEAMLWSCCSGVGVCTATCKELQHNPDEHGHNQHTRKHCSNRHGESNVKNAAQPRLLLWL